MNIIQEKLIQTPFFIEFDPYIFNSGIKYITKELRIAVSMDVDKHHSSYHEHIYRMQHQQNTQQNEELYKIKTLYNNISNSIYRYFIQEIINGGMSGSRIDKTIEQYYTTAYNIESYNILQLDVNPSAYNMLAYIEDDYYIEHHSPIILYELEIRKMEITNIVSTFSQYEHPLGYEVEVFMSYPDNMLFKNVLTDENDIKLFKRKMIIGKISKT